MTSAVDPVTAKRRHLRIANTLDLEGVSDTAVVSAIWKRRERKSYLSERIAQETDWLENSTRISKQLEEETFIV